MSTPEWSLRLAQVDDAPHFTRVEEDAAQVLAAEPSLDDITMPPARTPASYASMIRKGHCLTACAADKVIGFAATTPHRRELHLHELSVAQAFQRKGVGTTVLRALMVDARNSGFQAITLNTFRDIAWNAPFYARLGFREIGELAAHSRLASDMEAAIAAGLPEEQRCAMIRFLG